MRQDELFGLNFSNIPTMNLREEFNQTYTFVFSEEAIRALKPPIEAIETPLFTWFGMPDEMFTLLLQRAILGVEAYLPFALKFKAAQIGTATEELFAKLDNPFSFGDRRAVTNIYHLMPAEIHSDLSLQHVDKALYERTQRFYSQVRNPLFHGCELQNTDVGAMRRVFDHVAKVYEWVDGWYDPELVMKGFGHVTGIRDRNPKTG